MATAQHLGAHGTFPGERHGAARARRALPLPAWLAMDNRLDELRMERDELEGRLLDLERASEQLVHLRLVTEPGAAQPQAMDLAEHSAALFRRLATINAELAAVRSPPAPLT